MYAKVEPGLDHRGLGRQKGREFDLDRFKLSSFQTFKLFKRSNFQTFQTFKLSHFLNFQTFNLLSNIKLSHFSNFANVPAIKT